MAAFGSLGRGPGGAAQGCGVGWKAKQKELEREVRKVLSAEDSQLGEALH